MRIETVPPPRTGTAALAEDLVASWRRPSKGLTFARQAKQQDDKTNK